MLIDDPSIKDLDYEHKLDAEEYLECSRATLGRFSL